MKPALENVIYRKVVVEPRPDIRRGGIVWLVTQEKNCAVVWRIDDTESNAFFADEPPSRIFGAFASSDLAIDHCYEEATKEIVARKLNPDAAEPECDCTHPRTAGNWCEAKHPATGLYCSRPPGHRGDHVACNSSAHHLARWPNAKAAARALAAALAAPPDPSSGPDWTAWPWVSAP